MCTEFRLQQVRFDMVQIGCAHDNVSFLNIVLYPGPGGIDPPHSLDLGFARGSNIYAFNLSLGDDLHARLKTDLLHGINQGGKASHGVPNTLGEVQMTHQVIQGGGSLRAGS